MLERRNWWACELRASKSKELTIEGHAAVFNTLSEDLGGFKETVRPGAFTSSIGRDDIRSLFNHDSNLVLGRNKSGTLALGEDDIGLTIENTLPETSYARDLLKIIERGDVNQMSFGFRTLRDDWRMDAGLVIRELIEVQLFDVSPVTFPAYPQTDVSAREARSFYQGKIDALKVLPPATDPLIELSLRQLRLKLTERLLRGGLHG